MWNSIAGSTTNNAFIQNVLDAGSTLGNQNYSDQYFAFKFVESLNGQTDYGWIETSLSHPSTGTTHRPVLDIISYAYDASGAEIPMGALPNTSSVPEPSAAVALAALSALTLGAAGVRRMKALKAAA